MELKTYLIPLKTLLYVKQIIKKDEKDKCSKRRLVINETILAKISKNATVKYHNILFLILIIDNLLSSQNFPLY